MGKQKFKNFSCQVLVISCLFISCFSPAYATLTDDLFKQGMGIRAMGMGGSATAIEGDASAIFYNPAAMSGQGFEYSLGYTDLDRRTYSYSRFDLLKLGPFGYASYGLSTSLESGSFNMYGFGSQGTGGFKWGVNYKTARWNLSSGDGEGWSADLGILLKIMPSLSIGLVGQDIASEHGFVSPSAARVGVALLPLMDRMIFAGDLEIDSSRRSENLTHFGMELELTQGLKARVGSSQGFLTAGASMQILGLTLDYAMKNCGGAAGTIQSFGGSLKLGEDTERVQSLIGPKEYVEIDLRGGVAGGSSQYSLLGGYSEGLENIIVKLRRAARDSGISGVMIKASDFGGGLGGTAIVQEIRDALQEVKGKGKKVVVYVEDSALGDGYYLISVADKIIAPQGSSFGGFSRKIEITRVKDLYEKLGVEWQIFAIGKNKDTFSMNKDGLTEGQRKILQGIVTDLQRQMLTDIAADRKIDIAKIKDIGDGQIIGVAEAKKIGLVDEIGYYKDATRIAAEILDSKEDIKLIGPDDLMAEKDLQDYLFSYFNKVAVVEVEGEITLGGSGENLLFGGKATGADSITENIRNAVDDPQVKAIILRISSPGGAAVAAGQIYQEIVRARKKGKVVVASMGDVAASGGYYIASAANSIVADPATITGSIGVIGQIPALQGLYDKIGVKKEIVKEGKYADMFSGIRALTSEEVASIHALQLETYNEFVQKVVSGRDLPTAEVKAIADGRILTGKQALDLGLIDKLGGFQKAVDVAKDIAKIRGEPILVYYGRKSGFLTGLSTTMIKTLGLENGLAPAINKNQLNQLKLY
ncbi:MAG: signal peptide peptidase SppA [Candidatus Margulisiibacteriota bacterium]